MKFKEDLEAQKLMWEHTVWALESNYHASRVKDSKIYLPFKPDPLSSCSFLEQQAVSLVVEVKRAP